MTQKEVLEEAFKYQEALTGYVYGYLRDWSLAEDVVQQVFLLLVEKWQEYKPEHGIFPWIKRMANLKAKEMSRARRREMPMGEEELQGLVEIAMDENFDLEAAEKQKTLVESMEQCFGQLKDTARDLMVRYYWRNESCETIATALSRSTNAINMLLSRTRQSLRECISRREARARSLT